MSPYKQAALGAIARLIVFTAFVAASPGCGFEMGADYPGGGYDDYYPSDGYLATTDPIYFDGRASYWYGGRWNYREGGRWGHYDREPAGLYQRRMQGLQGRHAYESGHGHFMGRGGSGRGGGGGRGGGHR